MDGVVRFFIRKNQKNFGGGRFPVSEKRYLKKGGGIVTIMGLLPHNGEPKGI